MSCIAYSYRASLLFTHLPPLFCPPRAASTYSPLLLSSRLRRHAVRHALPPGLCPGGAVRGNHPCSPETYIAILAPAPGYICPSHSTPMPRGAAVVSIYNASYTNVAFEVYVVIGAFIAHIHNSTPPGEQVAPTRRFHSALQAVMALERGSA